MNINIINEKFMKTLLYGGMIAVALASCSNDETVLERNDNNRIKFDVTAATVSRATDVYCNNNKPEQFQVYAEYTGNGQTGVQYMDDQVSLSGTSYSSATPRYWPTEGTLDFFAYDGVDALNKADKTFDFTVASEVADQEDFIYAVKKAQAKSDNAVELNFRHALSQIVFKAKNNATALNVTVNSVGIQNLYGTNTYSIASITDNTDGNIEDHTGAGTDVDATKRGTWSALTGDHTQGYTATLAEAVSIPQGGTVENLTEGTDGTTASFANAMLLLPQTVEALNLQAQKDEAAAPNGGAYFVVNCAISNVSDGAEVPLYSGDIRIPVSVDWKEGYKYIYTFVFGNGNGGWDPHDPKPVLVPITFEVTVDDFIDVNPDDVNMDTNLGDNTGTSTTND